MTAHKMGTVWPQVGRQYRNYRLGQIIEIVRVVETDDSYAVTFRILPTYGQPNAPTTLFASDFHATYRPTPLDPVPVRFELAANERWYSVPHDEYVEVIGKGEGAVQTLGSSSQKIRFFSANDFTDARYFKRIVLRTRLARLRDS